MGVYNASEVVTARSDAALGRSSLVFDIFPTLESAAPLVSAHPRRAEASYRWRSRNKNLWGPLSPMFKPVLTVNLKLPKLSSKLPLSPSNLFTTDPKYGRR